MRRLRVVFMGTPDFAVPCLEALCEAHDVLAVVTQPDRPRGRGQKLQPSPVKVFALARGLPVWQPEKIKAPEAVERLRALQPELIVVVAFGQILSQAILDIPPLGCVNVHASLLPAYRGAAPIHWAIINGEAESGVTTMRMDAGLDTGDMLLKRKVKISQEMTTGELHDRLMAEGASLLLETAQALAEGSAAPAPQDEALSSYAPLLKKEHERIDWTRGAQAVHDLVRGLDPWPGAYCLLGGKALKLWRTRVLPAQMGAGAPGEVTALTADGFVVAAGDGALEILEVQPPGKRRMRAADFVRGRGVAVGERLS